MIDRMNYRKALSNPQLDSLNDLKKTLEQERSVQAEQTKRREKVRKLVRELMGQGVSPTFLMSELGYSRSRLYQIKGK